VAASQSIRNGRSRRCSRCIELDLVCQVGQVPPTTSSLAPSDDMVAIPVSISDSLDPIVSFESQYFKHISDFVPYDHPSLYPSPTVLDALTPERHYPQSPFFLNKDHQMSNESIPTASSSDLSSFDGLPDFQFADSSMEDVLLLSHHDLESLFST